MPGAPTGPILSPIGWRRESEQDLQETSLAANQSDMAHCGTSDIDQSERLWKEAAKAADAALRQEEIVRGIRNRGLNAEEAGASKFEMAQHLADFDDAVETRKQLQELARAAHSRADNYDRATANRISNSADESRRLVHRISRTGAPLIGDRAPPMWGSDDEDQESVGTWRAIIKDLKDDLVEARQAQVLAERERDELRQQIATGAAQQLPEYTPAYLNPSSTFFCRDLYMAHHAFLTVTYNCTYDPADNGKSIKGLIKAWLSEYDYPNNGGKPSNDAKDRIAMMANNRPGGGAPRTPTK